MSERLSKSHRTATKRWDWTPTTDDVSLIHFFDASLAVRQYYANHICQLPLHNEIQRNIFAYANDEPQGTIENADNQTLLFQAARLGHFHFVEMLVFEKSDIDLNAQDDHGWTCLHHASIYGHKAVVDLLLRQGASPHVRDHEQRTPLHLASIYGHTVVAMFLLERRSGPDSGDRWGLTPLHHASFNGVYSLARLLLENGANPNAQDLQHRTPLQLCSSNVRMVSILLCRGADPAIVVPITANAAVKRLLATHPNKRKRNVNQFEGSPC